MIVAKETLKKVDKLDPPVHLECDSRIKRWAWANGYGLVVALLMTGVTWAYLVVDRFA